MGIFTGRRGLLAAFVFALLTFGSVPAGASGADRLISQIKDASDTDRLQEKYDIIASQVYRYTPEGDREECRFYRDQERFIRDIGGTVTADKDGKVYGYNLEEGTGWRYLFVGDAYETFRGEEKVIPWERMDGSEVSIEHGAEVLKIVFQEPASGSPLEDLVEDYGYRPGPGDQIRDEFEMDADTKEILRWKTYLVSADEDQTLFEEGTVLFHEEKTEPEISMRNRIFSEDFRTVEVYADKGTEKETYYSQVAGHGCGVMILCDDQYLHGFYKDENYTELYEKSPEKYTEGNLIVYIKSIGNMGYLQDRGQ